MNRNFLLIWRTTDTRIQNIEWLENQEEMDERVDDLKEDYGNGLAIEEAIEIAVVYDFAKRYAH